MKGAWPTALRSLDNRDFRLFWISLILSASGTWMQIVAQSLLVLRLTHGSAFLLGCVSLSQALAFFLFALVGGGVADRLDRRRLLLVTQTLLMLIALTLGVLSATGAIRLWMIFITAFAAGIVLSFDQPARAAFSASLVPHDQLLNAVSLQAAVFNTAATFGPALAGVTVDRLGLPANFFANAGSFLVVLVALWVIRPPTVALPAERPRLKRQIIESLQTVRLDPVLPPILGDYAAMLFFGPSLPLLLPILAAQKLQTGASTLGLLFAAAGIGAIAGAVLLAALPNQARKGVLFFGALGLWICALCTLALGHDVRLAFAALFVYGLSQSIVGTLTSTLLQTRVPAAQRGRVMSLNTLLMMGVRPLGDFPAGALIGAFRPSAAVLLCAGAVGLVAASSLVRKPALRRFS